MSTWTLVLSPLPVEWDLLVNLLKKDEPCEFQKFGSLSVALFSKSRLACAVGGHGKTQFAIHASFLIKELHADGLICLGSAGSLSKDVKPFDVVVASRTIEHDYRLKFVSKPLPSFEGHPEWKGFLKEKDFSNFQMHIGPVASGDEDVIEDTRALQIAEQTQAIAVGWEGVGGARVAQFYQIPYLEIRGITDYADKNTMVDFRAHLPQAIGHCALVLKSLPLKVAK